MLKRRPTTPAQEAAFLRAEARFAVIAGGFVMAAGLLLVFVLVAFSLDGALSPWTPALYGAGPVLIGWAGISYGAWRYEQAAAVMRGQRPRRLYLSASRAALGRAVAEPARKAARFASRLIKREDV